MDKKWETGQVEDAGTAYRGWIVGSFIEPEGSARNTSSVEVKWATHEAGESRASWAEGDEKRSFVALLTGEFKILFRDGEVTLNRPGQFVSWHEGVDHIWHACADSTVITVRWKGEGCVNKSVIKNKLG